MRIFTDAFLQEFKPLSVILIYEDKISKKGKKNQSKRTSKKGRFSVLKVDKSKRAKVRSVRIRQKPSSRPPHKKRKKGGKI